MTGNFVKPTKYYTCALDCLSQIKQLPDEMKKRVYYNSSQGELEWKTPHTLFYLFSPFALNVAIFNVWPIISKWLLLIHTVQYSGGSRISQTGGRQPQRGGRQHTIWPIFPKNCMKMKKIWPRGGGRASLRPPLDPPMIKLRHNDNQWYSNQSKNYLFFGGKNLKL